MGTCSRLHSYDYPWQATFPKITIHLKYELQALTNMTVTAYQHDSKKLTDEAKFMLLMIFIFLMLAVIGTTVTVCNIYFKPPKKRRRSSDGEVDTKNDSQLCGERCQTNISERCTKFKELFNCFCILTNGRRILTTVPSEGEFLWMNGLRFIGSFWLIGLHVTFFYTSSFSNWNGLKPLMRSWLAPLVTNGLCAISLFFLLSGFLNGYFTSRDYFKVSGKISWLRFYWKRILRIAPLYSAILLFYAVLFPYISSGPIWPTYGTNPACKDSLWWNLFFINNLQTSWRQCFIPPWYVAADTQLYFISPLFLILLFKWPRVGYGFLALSICTSLCYRCLMTLKYDLLYSAASLHHYTDIDVDTFHHRFWMYMDTLYIKPIPNAGAYVIGIGLGHYIWKREISKKRRNHVITLSCGWIGFAISMWIIFDLLYFSETTLLKRLCFNTFSDFLLSYCVAWIIYVSATKQGGYVSRLLSLKIFVPLTRLSFAVYLINCMVILHYYFTFTKGPGDVSIVTAVGIFCHVLFWTYITSFIASLFIEVPMSRVLRLFHYI